MHSVCHRTEAVAITRSKFEVSAAQLAVMENTVIHHAEQEGHCEGHCDEAIARAILSTRAIAMRRLVGLPMQMTFLLTSYEQGWPGGVL